MKSEQRSTSPEATDPSLAGLSSEEAASRLASQGPNEIRQEKGRPPWLLFAQQFKSPLVLILIFACVLSAVLGEWLEATAIAAIVLINALIGFFQEYRAENAILALKSMTAPRARIMRDGRQMIIAARDVVEGDLLLLEAGDLVAADGHLIEASQLQINEAVLTGESVPAEKERERSSASEKLADRAGDVFMGTSVVSGTGTVRITATGMRTELGTIARLIATAESTATPLQLQLAHVGKTILYLCFVIVAGVAALGIYQGRPWLELLISSISLAVAAVPEGMPAIVTVALALGVQRMASRNALVRNLPSVETLGSVTVICTDKTGTLTTGQMRVRDIWGENHVEVIRVATACCDAELPREASGDGVGDPTELAILWAARERGIEKQELERLLPRISTEPFDSVRKRMSILRKDGTLYVKGAMESVLPLCSENPEQTRHSMQAHVEMSTRGLRVLAVAVGKGPGEKNLRLLGLIGIADPPRTEVLQAIAEARRAGITPIMITGDHPVTAAAIAREMGLVLEGEELEGRVHARATPEEKLELIRQWKSRGAIVAMTGDGVNDAPALKEAHIGIAMGKTGTEVTRQSADLILADDNFATIVAAVREGRGIYQNIRKALVYLLTGNFAELSSVIGAVALGLPLPFLASHLLWINLVTDALPGLTLIADPVSPEIMKRPPRPASEQILGARQWTQITWVGCLEAGVALWIFYSALNAGDLAHARNLTFTTLVFSQLLRAFGARSQERVFWKTGPFSNLWLLAVVVFTGIIQLALHYIPIGQQIFGLQPLTGADLAIMIPAALIPITVIETRKLILNRINRRN